MGNKKNIKLIECPRDAMQGWHTYIPTQQKIDYLNCLLQCGFDTLDFGSFVSHKAIPQLADTKVVLPKLNIEKSNTKLLAIVANTRGASEAVQYDEISYIGFPFSISETFQLKNTNTTISQSMNTVEEIQRLCYSHQKKIVLYISMGFGNPYGDAYTPEVVFKWVLQLQQLGITIFSLSDTVGVATPTVIDFIFKQIIPQFPTLEFGAHFHSTPHTRIEKIEAAFNAGCNRFDVAINGIGGCPMAQNELVGNMDTQTVIDFLKNKQIQMPLNDEQIKKATQIATTLFV